MRFKRSYLEVLTDDRHIRDIEEELSKGEWFSKCYNSDYKAENSIASMWLEQLTIIMLSRRSTEEQKDRSHVAQGLILREGGKLARGYKSSNRTIPKVVKRAVRKKYDNKCAACDSDEQLHFHHIVRYSDGGPHSLDNLMLLCRRCHWEEHEGEKGEHLLKWGLSTE